MATIFDANIQLDATSNLFIIVGARQGYNGFVGVSPWDLRLYFDGQLVNAVGGSGAISDVLSLFGTISNAPTGVHNVRVTWVGHSTITLSGANMTVLGNYV